MKRRFKPIYVLLITSLCLGVWVLNSAYSRKKLRDYPFPSDTTEQEKDILPQMLAINADSMPAPPKEFRPGHVQIIEMKDYLKQKVSGFEIKLPHQSNVPSASVYQGKVFVSGGFGSKEYFAFDAQTGENLWAIRLDDDGPSTAAIEEDVIVFNTESCTIFACDVETGEQLWSYWLGDPLMSSPSIAHGRVFTAYPASYGASSDLKGTYGNYGNVSQEQIQLQEPTQQELSPGNQTHYTENLAIRPTHAFAAFDLKTGEILWQKWIDGDVMSAPVLQNGFVYFTTFPGTLYKLKQETGEILSAKRVRATSAPVIDGEEVLLSKRSDQKGEKVSESIVLYRPGQGRNESLNAPVRQIAKKEAPYLDKQVQDQSELKELSKTMDAGNGFSGGAPSNSGWQQAYNNIGYSNVSSLQSFQGSRSLSYRGRLYNTMGDELICRDPKDGKEVWKVKITGDLLKAGGYMGTPPLRVGESIILATYTGDIMVFHAESGEVEKHYDTGAAIRYQPVVENGWIYATSTDGRLIAINTQDPKLKGWPMWGGNAARTNAAQAD